MTEMANPFLDDNFAKHLGIELIESGRGWARAKMTMEEFHLNGMGVMHGGRFFRWRPGHLPWPPIHMETWPSGIKTRQISFITAVTAGTLTAEAREVSLGNKLATYAVDVTNYIGEVIATFQGTAYRRDKKKNNSSRVK